MRESPFNEIARARGAVLGEIGGWSVALRYGRSGGGLGFHGGAVEPPTL